MQKLEDITLHDIFFLIKDEWLRNLLHIFLIIICLALGGFLSARFFNKSSESEEVQLKSYGHKFNLYPFLLFLAIAIGSALRFYGLNWGLPAHQYHPDEFEEAAYLQQMMINNTIISNYNQQPPLILYLSWPISILLKFFEIYVNNSLARDVLAGRIINAFAGIISIYLVFALGKRLFSNLTGIIAAFLLAVIPLHVTNSRYMKQDVLLVMFVLACALAVFKSISLKKTRYLYLAGVFAGLAFCSKYSGAACAGIILSTAWLENNNFNFIPNWKKLGQSILAVAVMVFSFFLSVPYVLISKENFTDLMHGIRKESIHAQSGHHGLSIDAWSQQGMFHFSRSLIPGMDLLPIVAALICIGFMLRRGNTRGLWLAAIVLFFYIPAELAHSKPPPQPDRYVLPCVPFIALLAAEMLQIIRPYLKKKTLIAGIALLLFFPLLRTILLASELTYDTRAKMTDWLYDNLPPGSKIVRIGAAAYLPRIPQKLISVSAKKIIGRDKSKIVEKLKNSSNDYLVVTNFSQGRFSIQNLDKKNKRAFEIRSAIREIKENFPIVKTIAPRWGSYGFHNPTITLFALH